jgi:hypothetical protein
MRYSLATKNGRKVRTLIPAVTNLIFVHATPMALKEVKKKTDISVSQKSIRTINNNSYKIN